MQPDILVSLSSLPGRLDGLRPVLEALLRQTLPPARVHLWLCPYYQRLNQGFSLEELPDGLCQLAQENSLLNIELVQDRGPITKLYPTLQRYGEAKETTLVILDDDRIVPPDFLATLQAGCEQTGSVCGFRGRRFTRPSLRYRDTELISSQPCWCLSPQQCSSFLCGQGQQFNSCAPPQKAWSLNQPVAVDILTGTGGMAFPSGALGPDFLNFWESRAQGQKLVDDIWINGYLARRGCKRYVIPTSSTIRTHTYRQPDSLARLNLVSDSNDLSIAAFAEHWSLN
ncbi:hypothetical protein JST97_13510 [bacterium]|nr:hypothetical protein [bacterium]